MYDPYLECKIYIKKTGIFVISNVISHTLQTVILNLT